MKTRLYKGLYLYFAATKEEGLLNRKFQELLAITDVIDNLNDAMMFTSNKYD